MASTGSKSYVPHDIDIIIMNIFETCTVPKFQLFLHSLKTNATLNKKTLTYEDVIDLVSEEYRRLVIAKEWDAISHEGGSAFATGNVSFQRNDRSGKGKGGKGKKNDGKGKQGKQKTGMPDWFRQAPKQGEPHSKEHNGKTWIWCGTCGKWIYGPRAHKTSDHVVGIGRRAPNQGENSANAAAAPAAAATPSVNTASSTESNPAPPVPFNRTWTFSGGF